MSADELRQAAETLRTRATMATPGPWETGERCVWGLSLSPSKNYEVVTDGPGGEGGVGSTDDADYIATMHPGVGLALADWLDAVATAEDNINDAAPRRLSDDRLSLNIAGWDEASSLAHLINGGVA